MASKICPACTSFLLQMKNNLTFGYTDKNNMSKRARSLVDIDIISDIPKRFQTMRKVILHDLHPSRHYQSKVSCRSSKIRRKIQDMEEIHS